MFSTVAVADTCAHLMYGKIPAIRKAGSILHEGLK